MASKQFLEKAYLAYFGRPVDPTGLRDFQNSTDAEVEAAFFASPESKALYGNTFGAIQVNAIYNVLFGRDAEPAGVAYWVHQVELGLLTPAGAALGIMAGAKNSDVTAVQNKLAASELFTAALDTAIEAAAYSGDTAAATARGFLQTIEATPATSTQVNAAVQAMVAASNLAPVAQNVTVTGLEDAAVISLMPVSSDMNAGDTATYAVNSAPAHGTVSFNAVSGKFEYVPAANYNGTDSFTYKVTDGAGATSVATATVIVSAVNDAPVAQAAAANVAEGGAVLTGSVSATDIDSAVLTYSLNDAAPAGLTFNGNGSYSFDPANAAYNVLAAGETSVLTVGYTVTDGALSDSKNLVITITGTNDAPVAQAAVAAGLEDALVILVTPASSDIDVNDTAAYTVNSQPAHGTVSFNAVTGNFEYVPAANYNGTDSFTYKVTDGAGATSVATATVIVTAVNDAPVAQAAAANVAEGGAVLTGSVSATDIDSAVLTYSLNDAAPAGLTFNGNGSYSFNPANAAYNALAAGETSVLTVGYTVTDGALSDSKNLVITITGTNDAPVAQAAVATGLEDALVITVTPVSSDIDVNDTAAYTVNSQPAHGTVSFNAVSGQFEYVPAANYNGTDSFTYKVTDGAGATSVATATVIVSAVNDAPVGLDAAANVAEGGAVLTGSVSATDIDSAVLTYSLNAAAPAGLTFNANGSYSFNPANAAYNALAAGESKVLYLDYTVTDGALSDNTKTLFITVTGTNDAPVALAAVGAGLEDAAVISVTPASSDVDALDTAVYSVNSAPAHGSVSFNATTGNFEYIPAANYNGTDSFTYKVTDGAGATSVATATVIVTAVNDAPVASGVVVSSFENVVVNGQVAATDIDGNVLTYAATNAQHGTVVMNAATGEYTFTPAANYFGVASFDYTANDGVANSVVKTVTIDIVDVVNVLTSGVDVISLTNSGAEAVLGANTNLNAGDSITGGAEDTVFLSIDSAAPNPANYASFSLNGIGTFKVTNDNDARAHFDMSSSTGVHALTSENSSSDVRFNFANMNAVSGGGKEVNLNVLNLTNGVNVTLDVRNDDIAGANDTANIRVTDSDDDGIDAASINLTAQGTGPVDQATASGIETVNLSTVGSTGGVRIDDFNTPGSTALNIVTALNQSLTIGDTNGNLNDGFANALSSTIATINAATATGNLNFSTEDRDAGSTTITLGSGDDSVITGDANDAVTAGAGNDTIRTGAGADSVQGNEGEDFIDAGTGQNTVRGGDDKDTITASGSDANQIFGDAGHDFITVTSTGAATIEGGTGDDTIIDVTGSSVVIDGDAGNDTITAGNATGNYDIDAGADNDTVNIGANLRSDSDGQELGMRATTSSLDGGAGTDKLNATTDSGDSNDFDDVTDFETINLASGAWNIEVTDNSAFDLDATTKTVIDATTAAVLNFQGNDLTPWTGAFGSDVPSVNVQRGDDVLSRDITVLGSAGNDTIITGLGNDSVAGKAGNDSIKTGAGNDTVTSGIGNDNVDLEAGDDRLIVNSGELNAEAGSDTVTGGLGNDTIELIHDGDDNFSATLATTTATLGGTVSGIETVLVTDKATDENGQVNIDFTAAYRQAAITVDGSALTAGDKLMVDTRAQDDDTAADGGVNVNEQFTLIGGAGNDTFYMGNHLDSGDAISGDDGIDKVVTDGIVVDADFTNVQFVDILDLTTGMAVVSSAIDDSVTLGTEAQEAGISTVNGGNNNDVINAAAYTAALTVNANIGNDTVITGSGEDTIHGNAGNDSITSNGGNDSVSGDAGNDTINAGEGNNYVDGGTDNDNIVTGSGMDTVLGGAGDDLINTGSGDDLVYQGVGSDNVTLGAGTNTVYVQGLGELEATDSIDGTLGTDIINLRDSSGTNVTATVNLNKVIGVENYLATDTDTNTDAKVNDKDIFTLNFVGGNVTTLNTITVSAAGLVDGDGDALNVNLSGLADKDFAFNITGANGNDTVTGSILPENLNFSGGAGDDVLNTDGSDMGSTTVYDGGTGIDTVNMISGALSDDSFSQVSNVEVITATGIALNAQLGSVADQALNETISNAVSIVGTAFNDQVIVDAAFNDGLIVDLSAGGNDRINVAASSSTVTYLADVSDITAGDTISGGTGTGDSLRLEADSGVATLTNVTGVETFIVTEDADFNATLNFVNGNFTNVASGILTVDATALNDDGFLGNPRDTEGSFIMNAGGISAGKFVVTSGTGADTIVTGSGNDIIDGGADYTYGAAASDNINAGEGTNTVTTRGGNDTIVTGGGDDAINSGAGNDTISSGAGNDNVQAGEGNNTVNAGDGIDAITAGNGNNVIDGGAGVDTITAGNGNNTLNGGLDNDTITAGNGNNVINGGAGIDTITVGGTLLTGNIITGGAGSDQIVLGAGADRLRIENVSDSVALTRDVVSNFTSGSDRIVIETQAVAALVKATFAANPVSAANAYTSGSQVGVNFAGNAADFSDAQGAISLTANDGKADYVFEQGNHKLWIDVNDDGILNGLDMQMTLNGVNSMVAGDVVLRDTMAPTFLASVGSVTENLHAATTVDANLVGSLGAADTDGSAVTYTAVAGAADLGATFSKVGAYGTLVVTKATGAFTYTKNAAAIEALDTGEVMNDTFSITATDDVGNNATSTYTVTVTGANDLPVLAAVTVGSVTEIDQSATQTDLNLTGNLTATDVDVETSTYGVQGGSAVPFTSNVQLAGVYGTLTVNTVSGAYSYAKNVAAIEGLDDGEAPTDTFVMTVTDGTAIVTRNYVVTLNGMDDAPTLAAVTAGTVAEQSLSALTTVTGLSGSLVAADVDVEALTFGIVGESVAAGVSTLVAATGTLSVNTSTGAYAFTPNPAAVEALALGETAVNNFTVTVTDGNDAVVTRPYTVTVTGSNDAPVITLGAADLATATVVETNATNLTATDTLTVNDVDTSNTVTASVLSVVPSNYVTGAPANATLAAMFGVTGGAIAADTGNTSNLVWTFNSGSTTFDYLAAGENLVLAYTVRVTDTNGAVADQIVTVTVQGANDAPVISVGALDAAVLAVIETNAGLTGTDTLTVIDLDTSNTVASTVTAVVETNMASGIAPATALGFLTVAPATGLAANAGDASNLTWTFNSGSEAFNYLAAGETTTLTYTVMSSDGSSNDTQDVAVTITGTNDVPVFSLQAGDVAVSGITETDAVISAAGTVTVRDLDLSNTVTTSVTAVSAVGALGSNSGAFLAMLTSAVGPVAADATHASNINWSFNSGAANAFDYLAAGEQVALTYTITGTDTSSATATQAVTITVTGTNDTPTMSFVSSTASSFTVNAFDPDASALLQLQTAVNGVTTVTNGGDSTLNVLQQGSTVVTDIVITDGIVDSAILKTLVQGTALDDTFAPTVTAGLYYGFGGNDNITGGANADIIFGGAGNDTVTGGADADVFDFSDLSNNDGGSDFNTIDTITDFVSGADTIAFSSDGDFEAGTVAGKYAENLTTAASLAALGSAAAAAHIGGAEYYFGVFNGDGYLVADDAADGWGTVIKLTGVTDMDAADITVHIA